MSGDALMCEAAKYRPNLMGYFARYGVPAHESEDLAQETYLRFWRYRDRYSPTAKLSTFLFLLARQVCLDAKRSEARRRRRETRWYGELRDAAAPSVPECVCGGGAGSGVASYVARLDAPHRAVVELCLMQEMPQAQAAARLGIPVGTVKSRMSSAMRKLRGMTATAAFAALAAASAVSAFAPRNAPAGAAASASPYALANDASPAAIAQIMRTQSPDGGWGSDFLTARNAAALAKADPACPEYRRALRHLRAKGLAVAAVPRRASGSGCIFPQKTLENPSGFW